jgi:hypothetical protein
MSIVTFFANSGIVDLFDVIEVTDPQEDEYNLLVKPKSVSANEWLRLLVKPAQVSRDGADEANIYSVMVTKPQTDVVLVCIHNDICLFKDNDIPLNVQIVLNFTAFDVESVVEKLQEFYQDTSLIAH